MFSLILRVPLKIYEVIQVFLSDVENCSLVIGHAGFACSLKYCAEYYNLSFFIMFAAVNILFSLVGATKALNLFALSTISGGFSLGVTKYS